MSLHSNQPKDCSRYVLKWTNASFLCSFKPFFSFFCHRGAAALAVITRRKPGKVCASIIHHFSTALVQSVVTLHRRDHVPSACRIPLCRKCCGPSWRACDCRRVCCCTRSWGLESASLSQLVCPLYTWLRDTPLFSKWQKAPLSVFYCPTNTEAAGSLCINMQAAAGRRINVSVWQQQQQLCAHVMAALPPG